MRKLTDDDTYNRAVADCAAHHAASKTFSGRFVIHHVHQIKEILDTREWKSVLSYGCGKETTASIITPGLDKTVDEYWGVPVSNFDPCVPDFAARPTGTYGLVIAIQVLCWVPVPALAAVIDDLYAYTESGIYVAEKIGPVKKQILRDQALAPRWTAEEWIDALARPGNGKHCTFAGCYQRDGYLEVRLSEVQ